MRILVLVLMLMANAAIADRLRMAVTTSFANSGLAEVLLPQIESDTGITVELLIVGTGQALRLGAAGDVDAVLVHARTAEEQFIAAGHSPHRRQIMYNDFVVVGPAADPAEIRGVPDAAKALRILASNRATFVSRGDDSGTHKREVDLWTTARIDPEGQWYRSVGQGMGASLGIAIAMNGYILTDRASWLNYGTKSDHEILVQGDPALFNQYAYLPVSPDKGPHIRGDLAMDLENWLVSDAAKALINGYRIDGQQVFTFNADR